ncbi:DUF3300 domain-containing protein [Cupriavidus sp. EM10]|uniref:DUF3300 domain-containing protein n=2 Tax=unclassified Cupriavidus TaxID=2640874 RepID=UPI001CEC8EB9|nr:DUF3300 domain-containing protein [Cupriavidus sp. EM10]
MTGGSGQPMRHMRGIGHWMLACLMAAAGGAWTQPAPAQQPAAAPSSAQGQQPSATQQTFKREEIEALVAPIALYPDSVLSQVLMASTYPLEVVQAARWQKANASLKGDAAVKAVQDQPWDVSVKSLVAFPQVLEPMNDKLDWTQKLGDAFLAQEKDVLAAVQRLRNKAQQSGNLKSNAQQNVSVQPATQSSGTQQTIIIEPANPQVIYVPAYNPATAYGSWGYPSYPPYYWPPYPAYYPGAALATGFAWGVGLAAAGAIFGGCNWGGGDVNINVNRATNIDRNFNRNNVEGGKWKHDASHRKGVAYRDSATREKFGNNVAGADRRNDFRGREGDRGGDRAGDRAGDRGGDRAGDRAGDRGGDRAGDRSADRGGNRGGDRGGDRAGDRGQGIGGDRASTGDRLSTDRGGGGDRGGDRGGAGANRTSYGGGNRDSAFQGVGGSGAASQRDFDRGRASAGGGGGGFQGGGARGGGGGFQGGGGGRGGGGFGGGGGRGGRR